MSAPPNLGLVLRDLGELATSEKLLGDGLKIVQKQEDDKYQVSVFLSYLSTVSLQAEHLEQAIERAKKALTLRQEFNMSFNAVDDLAILAAAYLKGDKMIEALTYAHQALTALEECHGEGTFRS